MKKIVLSVLLVGMLLVVAACASPAGPQSAPQPAPQPEPQPAAQPAAQPEQLPQIKVAILRGPSSVGAAWLMDQAENGQNNDTFTLADSPDQVVAMIANGTVDVAALPTSLAANLYAKTQGQVVMIANTTKGMLYLLEAGQSIQSWQDLRGKTIYATGRGADPEYILDYLLQANGLTPGQDVFVEYKSEHAELATLLASGQVDLAMLPEPFVTSTMMQNDQLRTVFDLSAEWQQAGAGTLAMTAMVARRGFAEDNRAALKAFLADLETSIHYAMDHVPETAALCEKLGIIPKAAVAERAIPRCNLTFITGAEMQDTIAPYFEVLYQANAQSVGGSVPDEKFYFIP